ncbi:hypothetical protein GQX74_002965 [Glossina fuscipes]|nr:hypothetical protein GQX74_002965 [Glossina fuscipes]
MHSLVSCYVITSQISAYKQFLNKFLFANVKQYSMNFVSSALPLLVSTDNIVLFSLVDEVVAFSQSSRLYYAADARETNLAERTSKGYGGYGGNGGLRQYYGYWQPDYQGQRNRGYGYYTNTDYYGLPRSQHGTRGQYINALRNYRGYD